MGQLSGVHDLVKFFRSNPQALALLIVCIVLGLGTFLAVMIGLITASSHNTAGYPEGLISAVRLLAA